MEFTNAMTMNRFDKNFNDIDTITGRPFSKGYPDGIWIIAVMYGFVAFFALLATLGGIGMLIMGKGAEALPLLAVGVVVCALFSVITGLLFKRSAVVLYFALGLCALALLGAALLHAANPAGTSILLVVALLQGYVGFYLYRLKSEALLGKNLAKE